MTPEESSAVAIAAITATGAHRHQARRDGLTPYIVHPARVAALARHFGGSPEAVIAAWLHDVIEDCGDSGGAAVRDALRAMRLPADRKRRIYEMILALTKDSAIAGKDERLDDSLHRVLASHPEATLVKLCDRIDNLVDARTRDAAFRLRYDGLTGHLAEILGNRARASGYGDALLLMERLRETAVSRWSRSGFLQGPGHLPGEIL